jgi:hypothetical protein
MNMGNGVEKRRILSFVKEVYKSNIKAFFSRKSIA